MFGIANRAITEHAFGWVAHASGLKPGEPWWLAWHFDSLIVGNLFVVVAIYTAGAIRAWRSGGAGKIISRMRAAAFFFGAVATGVALLSPLDSLGNDLSWVHMVQHMTMMVVAAPLMMFGCPALALVWAIPKSMRKIMVRGLASRLFKVFLLLNTLSWNPIVVWSLHAILLWVWHLPFFYEWALEDPLVHDVEHLTFFIIACLFWRLLLDKRQSQIMSTGLGVFYLFTTSLQTMFLGVFMALSPTVWYSSYDGRTDRWGLTSLEDQQLAGAIMWMPACMVYAVVAVLMLVVWLERLEPSHQGPFVSEG